MIDESCSFAKPISSKIGTHKMLERVSSGPLSHRPKNAELKSAHQKPMKTRQLTILLWRNGGDKHQKGPSRSCYALASEGACRGSGFVLNAFDEIDDSNLDVEPIH